MSENKLNEARLARIHEAFASVPYAKFLGLELGEMKPGEASLHLEAVPDDKNKIFALGLGEGG